jgi:hypothetical protein
MQVLSEPVGHQAWLATRALAAAVIMLLGTTVAETAQSIGS